MIVEDLLCDAVTLCPSHHGEACLHNGEHSEEECCCDECGYYLACFPDWKDSMDQPIRK